MHGPQTLSVLIKRSVSIHKSAIHNSPGIGGLESGRLLRFGAVSVSALVLGFWDDDDCKDWGGCGADFVLLRGFESCEYVLLLDSGLDPVRLRRRANGWDDGTGVISWLVWDGIGTGAIL